MNRSVRSYLALWAAPLALAAIIGSASQASALECPAPQKLAHPGVLQETPDQIQAASKLLASGDITKNSALIEADLRARYPGVENAELINYLVTAYCPVVNDLKGASDEEKQARMKRFLSDLLQMTY
jgi:hypothetical protein